MPVNKWDKCNFIIQTRRYREEGVPSIHCTIKDMEMDNSCDGDECIFIKLMVALELMNNSHIVVEDKGIVVEDIIPGKVISIYETYDRKNT